jgi:hypothetical protein
MGQHPGPQVVHHSSPNTFHPQDDLLYYSTIRVVRTCAVAPESPLAAESTRPKGGTDATVHGSRIPWFRPRFTAEQSKSDDPVEQVDTKYNTDSPETGAGRVLL